MVEERIEVQKQYALIEDAKNSQEQFVKDVNSLGKEASYDHLVDVCYRHMRADRLRKDTLIMAKAFFRVRLGPAAASSILDRILENLQEGHYGKFGEHDGVSFALSSLPDSMSIRWPGVRQALMTAREDGQR